MGEDHDQRDADDQAEPSSLKDSTRYVLEEARMLIPGAQVLFGFQLIAVFNQPFDRLTPFEQDLQLAATALTVIAIGLFMAPAAYHRQAEPETVSRHFLALASRHLAWGTVPLALLAFLALLWYGLPRLSSSRVPRSRRAESPTDDG